MKQTVGYHGKLNDVAVCEDRFYIETFLCGISISKNVSLCDLVEFRAVFHIYYLSKWIACCYKQSAAFPRAQINEKYVL